MFGLKRADLSALFFLLSAKLCRIVKKRLLFNFYWESVAYGQTLVWW